MKRLIWGLGMTTMLAMPNLVAAATWKIDPVHSSATFKVRHVFTKVQGTFNELSGSIVFDPANPTEGSAEATIVTASIDTKNEKRDGHLRSADFFDAEKFPNLSFKSTKVEKSDAGFRMIGDLTMRGVTKPVVLELEFLGSGPHPFIPNGQIAGFTGRTKLNRKDFGISWNKALDSGGALVGDDVEILIDVEAVLDGKASE